MTPVFVGLFVGLFVVGLFGMGAWLRNAAEAAGNYWLRWWVVIAVVFGGGALQANQRNRKSALCGILVYLCRDWFPPSMGEACVLMGESPASRLRSTLAARDSGRSVGFGPVDRLVRNRLRIGRLLARTCVGGGHCVGHRGPDLGFQDGRASGRRIRSRRGMTEPNWSRRPSTKPNPRVAPLRSRRPLSAIHQRKAWVSSNTRIATLLAFP